LPGEGAVEVDGEYWGVCAGLPAPVDLTGMRGKAVIIATHDNWLAVGGKAFVERIKVDLGAKANGREVLGEMESTNCESKTFLTRAIWGVKTSV
jgi:hypothetical protein